MTKTTLMVGVVLAAATACAEGRTVKGAAADVVGVTGKVEIRSGGKVLSAKRGDQLDKDDRVYVPVGGLALLHLTGNDYVVRIDEDLELAVKELAVFGAAKTTASAISQIDALISTEEKQGLNERMTGFYAGTSSGETHGSLQEPTRPAAPPPAPAPAPAVANESQAPPHAQASGGAPAKPARNDVALEKTKDVKETPQRAAEATRQRVLAPHQAKAADELAGVSNVDKKASTKVADAPAAKSEQAPAWPAAQALTALKSCLAPYFAEPGIRAVVGSSVTVRYRGHGASLRLGLEGAFPVPLCAADWLKANPPPSASSRWQSFELEL